MRYLMIIALLAAACAQPPECVQLDVTLGEATGGVVVCAGGRATAVLSDGTSVAIDAVAIGTADRFRMEVLDR